MQNPHLRRASLSSLGAALLASTLGVSSAPAQAQKVRPQQAQVALGSLPMRALWALESNDVPTLAKMAHSKGIRFWPFFSESGSKLLSVGQLRRAWKSTEKITWGPHYAMDEPVRVSWSDFRSKFLWSRDYSVGKISYSSYDPKADYKLKAYSNALFVTSYLPATDERNWSSLVLIFQREGKKWKLSGIASGSDTHV